MKSIHPERMERARARRQLLHSAFTESTAEKFRSLPTQFDQYSVFKQPVVSLEKIESDSHIIHLETIANASKWCGMSREIAIEANKHSSSTDWTTSHPSKFKTRLSIYQFESEGTLNNSKHVSGVIQPNRESYLKSRRSTISAESAPNVNVSSKVNKTGLSRQSTEVNRNKLVLSRPTSPMRELRRPSTQRQSIKSNELNSIVSESNSSISSRKSHEATVDAIIKSFDSRLKDIVQTSRLSSSHGTLNDTTSTSTKKRNFVKLDLFDIDAWRNDKIGKFIKIHLNSKLI